MKIVISLLISVLLLFGADDALHPGGTIPHKAVFVPFAPSAPPTPTATETPTPTPTPVVLNFDVTKTETPTPVSVSIISTEEKK